MMAGVVEGIVPVKYCKVEARLTATTGYWPEFAR